MFKYKRGVAGLDLAKGFLLMLMVIAIIGFAIIIAMGTLEDANVLTEDTVHENQSEAILGNVSAGVASFFGNAGTWMTLLSVVVIILIIAIVILAVQRFGGGRAGGL